MTINETRIKSIRFYFIFSILCYFLITSCGSGGSGTTSTSSGGSTTSSSTGSTTSSGGTVTTENYTGLGSKWDLSLNTSTNVFHVDHRPNVNAAIDYTVDGTYIVRSSGFVTLTVTASTGSAAPAVGDTSWALYIPGYAVMVKPFDNTSDQLIAMVNAGTCPTQNINANWVVVKPNRSGASDNANNANVFFAGSFAFDVATQTPTLPDVKALSNGFPSVPAGFSAGTSSCQNGVLTVPGATMYLTSTQGAIVHLDNGTANDKTDDTYIYGMPQKSITSLADTNDQYIGMIYESGEPTGNKIQPVSVSCTSGSCSASLVTNVETGTIASTNYSISLSGNLNDIGGSNINGFITGTVINGANVGNLICMADANASNSGAKIVSCVGQSPGDNNNMFNVLLVKR